MVAGQWPQAGTKATSFKGSVLVARTHIRKVEWGLVNCGAASGGGRPWVWGLGVPLADPHPACQQLIGAHS
jgi:hypothetical protein